MKAAIYPGTFDPPTMGHLNIIQRAARHFDRLVVAIGENPAKGAPLFSVEERVAFFKAIVPDIPNVEIRAFKGLLVDFAQECKIEVIVRAIRTIFDFEQETLQAQMNRRLGNIETFYLVVDEQYRSSIIARWVRMGIDSLDQDTTPCIIGFGQSCHVDEAFPATVHLIGKYERSLQEALIQSVMAGGDSAGRGMILGMVLGAYLGDDGLPGAWVDALKKKGEILDLLERIPRHR